MGGASGEVDRACKVDCGETWEVSGQLSLSKTSERVSMAKALTVTWNVRNAHPTTSGWWF